MYDMLIQGIGLIAFALFLLSYQIRSNRRLFAMQTLGNLLFALQFFLLGGVGGAIGSLISCFRLRDFIDFAFDLSFRIPRDGREPV